MKHNFNITEELPRQRPRRQSRSLKALKNYEASLEPSIFRY